MPFDFTYPAHVHDLGKRFWEGLTGRLGFAPGDLDLIHSRPSIVESGLQASPLRTIAAYLLKSPWYLLPNTYPYVGGWEVVYFRCPPAKR